MRISLLVRRSEPMKEIKLFLFWLLLALSFVPAKLLAESDWKLVKDHQGIQVYSRSVADSELNAVRGVTLIDATLTELVTLLRDPALRSTWDEHSGETYRVQLVNDEEELVYLHSKLPWPVSDRDMVNRVTWSQDVDSLVVYMQSRATKGLLESKRGRVRVTDASNEWVLRPIEGGLVEVTTTAHLDPAGPLPAFLLNMLSVESPYRSLLRLRAFAEEGDVPVQHHRFLRLANDVNGK